MEAESLQAGGHERAAQLLNLAPLEKIWILLMFRPARWRGERLVLVPRLSRVHQSAVKCQKQKQQWEDVWVQPLEAFTQVDIFLSSFVCAPPGRR